MNDNPDVLRKHHTERLDGAITVDFEDWRCALDPDPKADYRNRPEADAEYLKNAARDMLRELDAFDAKGTFFVLGEVAKAVPETLQEISRRGHEIASHSPVHLPPRMIPREEYRQLVARDVELIEQVTGKRPLGFRVPYLSITRSDGWILSLLADLGFQYDSSVAPTWTPYWGIPFAPKSPYFPDFTDLSKQSHQTRIVEVPLTVWPSWKHLPGLPIAGGFYMRVWPKRVLHFMMNNNSDRGQRLNLYIHPGNLQSTKTVIQKPTFRDKLSQYSRLEHGLPSFQSIMREFRFGTISQVFSDCMPNSRN
jgi:polysaccharide deacetylase family protein (PEP-CTERM system associated)